MWKVIPFALVQSALLAGGQVFLKLALAHMKPFECSWAFWGCLLTNWQLALCGILFLGASLLWMFMLKTFPLSVAYPLGSLSYVFGILAAILIFHEDVSMAKWIGVGLIMAGCGLIVK